MLVLDILRFHPHAFSFCALRELGSDHPFTGFSVVTDLNKSGKQFVLAVLEEATALMPARMLAEIALADCLAEIDPEKLVASGAPRDEYSSEARMIAKALHQGTTPEQLTQLLEGRFIGVNTYGSPAEAAEWAATLYSAVKPFLLNLEPTAD